MDNIEYVFKQRKELVNTARKIVYDKIDIIEGCRIINSLWHAASLPETDNYYFFEGIDSESEEFVKGDIRKNFSIEYLKKVDEEEENYLKDLIFHIKNVCEDIIKEYSI